MQALRIERVRADIEENDFLVGVVEKFKKDAVPRVDGKTPLPFQLPMEAMSVEAGIKRLELETRNLRPCRFAYLRIETPHTSSIASVRIDRHTRRTLRELWELPRAMEALCIPRPIEHVFSGDAVVNACEKRVECFLRDNDKIVASGELLGDRDGYERHS